MILVTNGRIISPVSSDSLRRPNFNNSAEPFDKGQIPIAPTTRFLENNAHSPTWNDDIQSVNLSYVIEASPYAVLSISHNSFNYASDRIAPTRSCSPSACLCPRSLRTFTSPAIKYTV